MTTQPPTHAARVTQDDRNLLADIIDQCSFRTEAVEIRRGGRAGNAAQWDKELQRIARHRLSTRQQPEAGQEYIMDVIDDPMMLTETKADQLLATRLAVPTGVGREEVRERALAIVKAEAADLGYCEDDIDGFDRLDGDDILTVQAAERALLSHAEAAGVKVPSGLPDDHANRAVAQADWSAMLAASSAAVAGGEGA